MPTLINYKTIDGGDVQEVSPDPIEAGGLALNTNFRAIADSLPRNNYGASTNPTPDNDSVDTAGIGVDFSKGSRWYNGTAIFECVDPAPTAAVWVETDSTVPTLEAVTTAGATTDQPVTLSGGASLAGSNLNMNTGSGTGGGTLNLDGGWIYADDSQAKITPDGGGGWNFIGDSANVPINISQNGTVSFNSGENYSPVNLNDGSGSGGGNLNMEGGTVNFGTGSSMVDNGYAGVNFFDADGGFSFVQNGYYTGAPTITIGAGEVSFGGTTNVWSIGASYDGATLTLNNNDSGNPALSITDNGYGTYSTIDLLHSTIINGTLNCTLDLTNSNIHTDTSTGSQIGTASDQKLAFWAATPIVQPSGSAQAAVPTTTPTTGAYGFTSAQATAIITLLNELRAAMVAVGLIKGSA